MNGRTNSAGGALVSDMEIPLDPCTDFVGVRIKDLEYLGKIRLAWTDPKDKYATPEGEAMEDTDQLVSKWSYTQIVRQADRAPVNPSDGVTVCTETTRNQYQTTGFIDMTAESNVTYYYAAYAFNEDGVYSEVISNGVQPVSFSTTLADNTWEEIDQACTLGLAESLWEIGDTKNFNYTQSIGSVVTVPAVIIDFNHDILSDGSGNAVITFTATQTLADTRCKPGNYNTIDTTLDNNISKIDIPADIIRQVTKYGFSYDWRDGMYSKVTSNRQLFVFNMLELNYDFSNCEGSTDFTGAYGIVYQYFTVQANKAKGNDNWIYNKYSWSWDNYGWYYLNSNGGINSNTSNTGATSYYLLSPGFCIGKVAV